MTLMPQRWTTFFAAAVVVASLACGEVLDVEEEQVPSSFEELLEQAEQGDAGAQYELGGNYSTGRAYVEAVRWYRLAADQGHDGAQFKLGAMYFAGEGVPQDLDSAPKVAGQIRETR